MKDQHWNQSVYENTYLYYTYIHICPKIQDGSYRIWNWLKTLVRDLPRRENRQCHLEAWQESDMEIGKNQERHHRLLYAETLYSFGKYLSFSLFFVSWWFFGRFSIAFFFKPQTSTIFFRKIWKKTMKKLPKTLKCQKTTKDPFFAERVWT